MEALVRRGVVGCTVILSLACASHTRTATTPPTRIVLERSGCYGNCPAYQVVITDDGAVKFVGHRFAVKHARDHITPEAVRALLARFEDANFAAVDTGYQQGGSRCGGFMFEMDGATLTVQRATGSHRVDFYNGCVGIDTSSAKNSSKGHYVRPEAFTTLYALAAAVDSAASTTRWFRTDDWSY